MRSQIALENIRRLSAITSLYQQAADGGRVQKVAPLAPAEEPDQVALAQLLGDEPRGMQLGTVLDNRKRHLVQCRGQAVNTESDRGQFARSQRQDAELGRSGDDFGDGDRRQMIAKTAGH